MGLAADKTCLQFKRLNSRKGPAVRGTRMQSDKELYQKYMSGVVSHQENLTLFEGEVKSLVLEKENCRGVVLNDGSRIQSLAVIVTTGTFLNGVMHVGLQQTSGGRVGDQASQNGISDQLASHGFHVRRLKTGNPPGFF